MLARHSLFKLVKEQDKRIQYTLQKKGKGGRERRVYQTTEKRVIEDFRLMWDEGCVLQRKMS